MMKWQFSKIIKEYKNYRIVYKSMFLIDSWFKYKNFYFVQDKITLKFMFWTWNVWRDIGMYPKFEKAENLARILREDEIKAFL